MSTERVPPIIIPAKANHSATLIFAHGLGDQGAGWAHAARYWQERGNLDHVKIVLPNATRIPITAVSRPWR